MTGIKDVAREVGVSTATVSRALRGLPRVSPDTRERVLEVAGRMGYVASPHAASLASGQTRAIGVVVPNVTRWFFGSIVHGAEELLREEGYDLLLYSVVADPAARKRLFSTHLLSKRVDAVMVLALRPTPEEVEALDRTGSPTVVVGGAWPAGPGGGEPLARPGSPPVGVGGPCPAGRACASTTWRPRPPPSATWSGSGTPA